VEIMRRLIERGAWMPSDGDSQDQWQAVDLPSFVSTAECCHRLLMMGVMQRIEWSEDDAEMAALVVTASASRVGL
jgi:hypothetical protein